MDISPSIREFVSLLYDDVREVYLRKTSLKLEGTFIQIQAGKTTSFEQAPRTCSKEERYRFAHSQRVTNLRLMNFPALRLAFHVAREQRTDEYNHASREYDEKKNCERRCTDQQFRSKAYWPAYLQQLVEPSGPLQALELISRLACHPKLRKQKRVNVSRLFDAFAQRRADAMARTGAGS